MACRYMGHSWASGLQASLDGKNQESSSEAANAYLAIVQLGKATGDAVLEGWGQLLLANEVTAGRKYTQVYSDNDIYQQVRCLRLRCRLWGYEAHCAL
jgi:endo-1,3(4)-beta-glucanase